MVITDFTYDSDDEGRCSHVLHRLLDVLSNKEMHSNIKSMHHYVNYQINE